MATLSLRGLSKSFGAVEAVTGVDLDVAEHEFVVLVGPSGCGKSTILRMIAGLEEPTSGDIVIDGTVVTEREPKDRDIAMVFQDYALYPHMTVAREHGVCAALSRHVEARGDPPPRGGCGAACWRSKQLLQRTPRQLSGGQRQRVAMGRAIVRDPKLFLFDEPLSNLDAKLRVQMRTELRKLRVARADDDGLCDARPGGGDDAGRSDRDSEPWPHGAGRARRKKCMRRRLRLSSPASSVRRR